MIADPTFKAEVEKQRIELDSMDGATLHRLVERSLKISNETRDSARAFYDDMFK